MHEMNSSAVCKLVHCNRFKPEIHKVVCLNCLFNLTIWDLSQCILVSIYLIKLEEAWLNKILVQNKTLSSKMDDLVLTHPSITTWTYFWCYQQVWHSCQWRWFCYPGVYTATIPIPHYQCICTMEPDRHHGDGRHGPALCRLLWAWPFTVCSGAWPPHHETHRSFHLAAHTTWGLSREEHTNSWVTGKKWQSNEYEMTESIGIKQLSKQLNLYIIRLFK